MAEVRNLTFNLKEITELLIKKADIHEGLWAISIEFALGATNISSSPDSHDLLPAAIVPVKRIGIQKFDESNPLTVDASVVNPSSKKAAK